MAVIGDQLLNPDIGWIRIQETDTNISYIGSWLAGNGSQYNGGTMQYQSDISAKYRFNFTGTKIRIITCRNSGESDKGYVIIDGVKYPYSEKGALLTQVLSFELLNLENKEHTVIVGNDSTVDVITVDSIDIDSGGVIKPYNPWVYKTKTSLSQMEVGDRIIARYTATSNTFGTISDLGISVAPEIPLGSSITPNGSFYFIHVGYDFSGKMKLVADRNIQTGISYDTLNTAGVASDDLYINIDGKDGYNIRLLSGGTSATDKDNEWDKIICESTLNDTIIAGDNLIWNWNQYLNTITSTIIGSNYVSRGVNPANGGIAYRIELATSYYSNRGFRPVLLVDVKNNTFLILKDDKVYSTIGGILTETSASFSALTNTEKAALFTSNEFPTISELKNFINFDILVSGSNILDIYKAFIDAIPFKTTAPVDTNLKIIAVPKTQFIHANEDMTLKGYSNIDWFHVNDSITEFETGGGKVRHLASRDKGITYYAYNGTEWVLVLDTANTEHGIFTDSRFIPSELGMNNILTNGMTKTQFDSAPWQAWTIDLGYTDMRFGYFLNIESTADKAFCDNLKVQYDGQGRWRQAINGTDYYAEFANGALYITFLTGGYRAKVNY